MVTQYLPHSHMSFELDLLCAMYTGCLKKGYMYEWNVYVYAWVVHIRIPVKRDIYDPLFPAGKGQCVSETN